MKIVSRHIISVLMLVLSLFSCVEEDFYNDNLIPEGETEIVANISFPAFAPALATRSAGGASGIAISDIETLYILIYEEKDTVDENGNPAKVWKLEKDGRILLNAKDHSLTVTNPSADRADKDSQVETETAHASFRLNHKNGTYKIYAVANVDFSPEAVPDKDIETPEKLKAINVRWYTGTDNVGKNNGMFGYFTNDKNAPVNDTETVIVSPNQSIHAWIRRAASKVTIAYNGSGLADRVEVYVLAATIRDIPVKCPLGMSNEPDARNLLIEEGDTILYYKNDVNDPNPNDLTLDGYAACVTNKKRLYGSDHSVAADALFFYENMQGEGKSKKQTAPGPGNDNGKDNAIGFPNPDKDVPGTGWKDDKPFGTYVEVDAYYRSTNPVKPGSGIVKYRFMLGKDTDKNYDAERNFHYKLTLNFKGYANDYDWHIDYDPGQAFEVTEPKVFNYTGKVFVPDYFWPNGMHTFSPENTITVTSYVGNVNDQSVSFKDVDMTMEYDDSNSPWLTCEVVQGKVPYQKDYVFKVREEALKVDNKHVKKFNINALLKANGEKGTSDNPINLADLNRNPINTNAHITCTANCYMVDAAGWYILPLVYGNAIHNGKVIEASYKPYNTDSEGENILTNFKNYNGENITSAFIEKDLKPKSVQPFMLWQDVNGLVEYIYWNPTASMKYVPNAFYDTENRKTVGGVKFHVAKGQQGNSVIGVAESISGSAVISQSQFPKTYWSWHIWVTCLDKQLDDDDKTIKVQGHEAHRIFDVMPVNLGWCSGADDDIIYYKERTCTVRFTFTDKDGMKRTEVRNIVKKSHIALTRGYNPYYQWGRKDPFTAVAFDSDDKSSVNVETWISQDWSYGRQNPMPLTTFTDYFGIVHSGKLENRYHTRDALGYLIQYPYAWHNPPREEKGDGFVSINKTYVNLWEGRPGVDPDAPILKTVYDPCPVGYQVPHINMFSGFTTTGLDSSNESEWYDVRSNNILNYDNGSVEGGPYARILYEFYTNPDKTQSIIFPINGYRDWDGDGNVYHFGLKGYAWAAGNYTQNDRNFFNFEFAHDDHNKLDLDSAYIRPRNVFYSCDGFPVRPVRNGDHGADEGI